jgi:hypothetical protein
MAATTPTQQYITALGPIKMEIVHLPATTDSGDTFTTRIQNPLFAIAGGMTTSADPIYCTISSRTVTVSNAGGTANLEMTVLVFGF